MRTLAIVVAVASAMLAPSVAAAQNGISEPMFASPNGAAYCGIAETLAPENPVLKCWTPNDGFVASIQWDQCCARPQYGYSRRLKGYYPRGYRQLNFGRHFGYRCTSVTDHFAQNCTSGIMIFFCSSKRDGLRCYNTQSSMGFWLGRFRGYRTVLLP